MIIRQINGQNDWQFGKGLASYAFDEQAVEENVQTRLKSWVNDCFFALRDGIDWRARLDVGQEAELKDELTAAILQSYGVISVDSVTLTRDTKRNLVVTYTISTIFGQAFTGLLSQS